MRPGASRFPFIWTPFLFMRDCIQWPATWPIFWNASLRWDMQTRIFPIWPGRRGTGREIDSPEGSGPQCGRLPGLCGRQPDVWDAGYSWTLVPEWNTGLLTESMEEEAPCRPINEYGKAKWEFYSEGSSPLQPSGPSLLPSEIFPVCTAAGSSMVHHIHPGAGFKAG